MKAITAFVLAAALLAYAAPAMADLGPEALNTDIPAAEFVPLPRAAVTGAITTPVHSFDESRPDVRF